MPKDKPKTGKNVFVAETAVIYHDVEIGDNSKVFDYVVLREGTRIGKNTTIGNGVCAETGAKIGNHCGIGSQCHITNDIIIEDYVFFGPNVTTTNVWKIGFRRDGIDAILEPPIIRRGTRVGGGATILPRVEIGEEAMIAAGSVVMKNVGKREVWAGNPARKVGTVPEDEWLQV
ncbi:MAG: DapH/DapD/GlmU-related protein [Candidatus Thorarchaeota archaeon]